MSVFSDTEASCTGRTQLTTEGSSAHLLVTGWAARDSLRDGPGTISRQGQPPPNSTASRCGTRTRRAPSLSNSIGRTWPTPDTFSTSKDCTCGMLQVPNLILTDVCLCICGTDTPGRIFHLFFPGRKVSDNPLLGILTPTLLFSPTLFYLLLHCNVVAVIVGCCASVCFKICLKSGLWGKLYFISVFFGHFQLMLQSFSYKKFILPSSSLIFWIACSEEVHVN